MNSSPSMNSSHPTSTTASPDDAIYVVMCDQPNRHGPRELNEFSTSSFHVRIMLRDRLPTHWLETDNGVWTETSCKANIWIRCTTLGSHKREMEIQQERGFKPFLLDFVASVPRKGKPDAVDNRSFYAKKDMETQLRIKMEMEQAAEDEKKRKQQQQEETDKAAEDEKKRQQEEETNETSTDLLGEVDEMEYVWMFVTVNEKSTDRRSLEVFKTKEDAILYARIFLTTEKGWIQKDDHWEHPDYSTLPVKLERLPVWPPTRGAWRCPRCRATPEPGVRVRDVGSAVCSGCKTAFHWCASAGKEVDDHTPPHCPHRKQSTNEEEESTTTTKKKKKRKSTVEPSTSKRQTRQSKEIFETSEQREKRQRRNQPDHYPCNTY